MPSFKSTLVSALALVPALVAGELSGSVGPLTSVSDKKATKTCDVTDYGAKADKTTDLGAALASAHADCKSGGLIVIPEGDYAISTWVKLAGGSAWALQIDGTIYRTGTDGGNMVFIEHTSDVEVFSSTGKGAFQGNGYEFHKDGSISGPRILRFYDTTDFSVHDLALVDSPSFHFSIDTCKNGEIYNLAIRGGDHGGLDGIDVWSDNMWIHDVMVTNKDECVTVKSPAHNVLVENIYCNWSGGCAFGSLAEDTDISDITYRNVYTVNSNQMMMIKSYGGSGTVSNVVFDNFIGRGNAYSLDIDQYWASMSEASGDGVQLNNLTFSNWKGTCANGAQRGPIKVACADGAPCTDITITDFAMWTESGDSIFYSCRSGYGDGACLKSSGSAAYDAVTTTINSAPSGYTAASMPDDIEDSLGFTVAIDIPSLPASYFPNVAPISPLNAAATAEAVAVQAKVSTSAAASTPAATTPAASTLVTSTKAVASAAPATSATSAPAATSSAASGGNGGWGNWGGFGNWGSWGKN
ncbi:Glycoside hydrolase family 28 [Lasiodiplodia theobromae]|uniref:Rhamnogalacturonase b n=1 Tax=Lasiodiplodia theobromae TaxID=45133 RepID=UPI0015C2E2E3|nr:Rhamnogalacturonase b [Lasiodiplodia theobromae]KAF4534067.1 Rhamnogalacturonase b [Lasiodiplodia theobromae]KAF9633085.1 Glycoside hydrolase family 28 [Lasiodiplodia theobromae]